MWANKITQKPSNTGITWGPYTAVIVVIAIYIVAQIAGALIISIYPALKGWNHAKADVWLNGSVMAAFWLTLMIEGIVLVLLWGYLKRRKSNFKEIGLRSKPKWETLLWVGFGYLIYIVPFIAIVELLHQFIPGFNIDQTQEIGFNYNTHGQILWLVFISLVLLPPIVEEILFRGFLYSGLKTKLPKIYAALITSAIFASLHLLEGQGSLLWIAGLDTFILSMVLVFLLEKTGNLYASIGLHMLKNTIAFVVLFHIS